MGLTIQHSKLSKRSSHCANITQLLSAHYFYPTSFGHWGSLTEALLAVSGTELIHGTDRVFHTLWSPSQAPESAGQQQHLVWLKPCFQELACTTAGKSASTFPHGSWEQVQGYSTSVVPPSPSLYLTGSTLGNTTISKQQSKKRCKEYSKCLLCIKNTANKPYSSFHSNLNNIVQELEKSTKNSAAPTVTTVTLMPWLPLSLTAILSHLQWEQHWIWSSILFI